MLYSIASRGIKLNVGTYSCLVVAFFVSAYAAMGADIEAGVDYRIYNTEYRRYLFVSNDKYGGDRVLEAHPHETESRNTFRIKKYTDGTVKILHPDTQTCLFVSNDKKTGDNVVEAHSWDTNEERNYFRLVDSGSGRFRIYNPTYGLTLFVSNDREGPDNVVEAHHNESEQRNLFEFRRQVDTTRLELTAELYDFSYPGFGDMISRLTQDPAVRLEVDQAMFDTVDIGPGCVGVQMSHDWSRTFTEDFSWGLNQELGVGLSVTAKGSFLGIAGAETSVSTSFKFGAHQDWRTSTTKSLSHHFSFSPQTQGVYKLGCFTIGMEGYTIPFSAKVLYKATSADGKSAPAEKLESAVRAAHPGVRNLRGIDGAIVGNVDGTLHAKSATQTVFVARKVA